MFEWQKHSQDHTDVPPYRELLEFIDLRARASETSPPDSRRFTTIRSDHQQFKKGMSVSKHITSYPVTTSDKLMSQCVSCKIEKHPLYMCTKFKALPHTGKMSILKANELCINCLRPGHFVRQCRSIHRCKVCQKPHHSLLHTESRNESEDKAISLTTTSAVGSVTSTSHAAATEFKTNVLLMTCKLLIEAPNGSMIEACGLLDSASSVSFVSERIIQTLGLSRSTCNAKFSGIAGMLHNSNMQSIATFNVSPVYHPNRKINLSAIILPRVTCNLPVSPISFDSQWNHLSAGRSNFWFTGKD